MVIDGFEGWAYEEGESLAGCEAGGFVCEGGADCVEEEAFEGVVVEGAVGVGDVETVVAWVEGC